MTVKKKAKSSLLGKRMGTKRRDMRFIAPDGSEWDSRFEWIVYDAYKQAGSSVRRTEAGGRDTLSYSEPVRSATCDSCGATAVSKSRRYTPDLFYHTGLPDNKEEGYYIEVKGYIRAEQRSLIRAFAKARKDVDLRYIYQRDFPVSRTSTVSSWHSKCVKRPYVIWDGKVPTEWKT